jgi:hypothetical protein
MLITLPLSLYLYRQRNTREWLVEDGLRNDIVDFGIKVILTQAEKILFGKNLYDRLIKGIMA